MGKRISEDDPYFSQISHQWSDTLRRGLQEMPNLPMIIGVKNDFK